MADRPDSANRANRAKPVLSVMMSMAELWGYRPHNSNPCKNTRAYRTEPKERFLTPEELARLNAVLNRDAFWCPHIVAIVRLLMLTGCRLGEIVSLEWDWIRGKRIHLPDSKSGPRTVWLSSAAQVFPEDLTSARLYTFWVGIRGGGRAGGAGHPRRPPHPRLAAAHERRRARHRGEELPGHRRRATTAIYAHLDDAALRDAAAQAAAVIASAMGYRAGAPALPDEADGGRDRPGRAGPARSPRTLARPCSTVRAPEGPGARSNPDKAGQKAGLRRHPVLHRAAVRHSGSAAQPVEGVGPGRSRLTARLAPDLGAARRPGLRDRARGDAPQVRERTVGPRPARPYRHPGLHLGCRRLPGRA